MSSKAKQRLIRLLLILGIISGLCLFLAGALRENIVFFKTPTELSNMENNTQKLRLGGLVVTGSIKTTNNCHQFQVTDQINTVTVKYKGRFPDLFREGQGVVAVGTYDASKKLFMANQLLAKHDQYYRPPQK
ncbi:MAG: cytochrome c maturation protein CcmE [Proteobacteria bacterium]|nr:cytochrome c maturation protein CcmE [Pseudomonadota bacterium]